MNTNTYELVFLARNGDADAFGELYNMYAKEMYCYACSMVKNTDLAQDAVQEAAMTAFKEIKKLRNVESFKGWLFKILNICCRKQFNASVANLSLIDEYDYDNESNAVCVNETANTELSIELKKALSILTAEERKIVMMRIVYEYDSREMSKMLNISDSTIRSKLRRSLEKLRNYMISTEAIPLAC